jgi:hypothetical protein
VTPCCLVSYNQRFGGIYRLHLQGEAPPKRWLPPTEPHSVRIQQTTIDIFTIVITFLQQIFHWHDIHAEFQNNRSFSVYRIDVFVYEPRDTHTGTGDSVIPKKQIFCRIYLCKVGLNLNDRRYCVGWSMTSAVRTASGWNSLTTSSFPLHSIPTVNINNKHVKLPLLLISSPRRRLREME